MLRVRFFFLHFSLKKKFKKSIPINRNRDSFSVRFPFKPSPTSHPKKKNGKITDASSLTKHFHYDTSFSNFDHVPLPNALFMQSEAQGDDAWTYWLQKLICLSDIDKGSVPGFNHHNHHLLLHRHRIQAKTEIRNASKVKKNTDFPGKPLFKLQNNTFKNNS